MDMQSILDRPGVEHSWKLSVDEDAGYKLGIEVFSPDKCRLLLENNGHNRKVSITKAKEIAAAMKRGEWRLNGETIIIAANGDLLDGAHRCTAAVLSDLSFKSVVVRGMSRDVFETLDSGKRRSAADVLGIEGHKNATVLTSGARFVIRTTGRGRSAVNPSNAQVNACVKDHPRLDYWSSQYAGSKMKSFMPASICGLLTLAEELHGTELVSEFFEQVATGIGVTNESPAYTLREKFIEFGRGVSIARQTQDAYLIKAMNAHVQGKKLKLLRMTPTELTPQLIGLPA